jgi:hypothetical protein
MMLDTALRHGLGHSSAIERQVFGEVDTTKWVCSECERERSLGQSRLVLVLQLCEVTQ